MKALQSFLLGFLTTCLLLFPRDTAAEGFKQRDVLQTSSRYRLTRESELQDAFSDLDANHHIFMSSHHPFILTETLVVDVDDITLTGRSHNGTTIICPPDTNGSAIVIKGMNVHLENLKFRNCNGESAVVIEPAVGSRQQQTTVSFLNVQFLDNGLGDNKVNGPAVHVKPCAEDNCRMPLLEMDSCLFQNNHGRYGGAIYAEDADLRIRDCEFFRNSAAMSGGAIYSMARGGNLIIRDGVFENNTAKWNKLPQEWDSPTERVPGTGGAITAISPNRTEIQGVHFNKNTACIGGGALDLVYAGQGLPDASLQFRMSETFFDENWAYCGKEINVALMNLVSEVYYIGGAVLQSCDEHVKLDWQMTSTTFHLNRARYGGAMHLASAGASVFPLLMSDSFFWQNSALRGGGAIDIRGATVRLSSTIFRQNKALWGGAVITWFAGSFFTDPNPEAPGKVSIMEENSAVYGGAIQYAVGGWLVLTSLTIRNNTGYRYGGGIRLFASTFPVVLSGITMENNRAFVGGAIATYTTVAVEFSAFEGKPCLIANNTASVGGGIYYDSVHYLPLNFTMEDTVFIGNKAAGRGDAEIEELIAEGKKFEPYEGASIIDPFQFEDYYEEQSIADILSKVPGGQGGGLCMTLANIQFFTVVQVIMQRITFENNEAVVGGGASIHFSDLYWDKGDETHCSRATVGAGTCQRFYMSNVTIQRNRALFAGGLFTTHPRNLLLTCDVQNPELDASFERIYARQIISAAPLHPEQDLKCMLISDNEITDGASIDAIDAGTSVHALMIDGLKDGSLKEVASGEPLAIPCPDPDQMYCDGKDLLIVIVKDAFNHTIARGIDDAQLELTLLSDSVMGDVRYTATNGSAVINNTQAYGIGIESSITLECESDRRVHVSANFNTRKCYPGEYHGDNICHRCQADVYGFLPHEGKCEKCEQNAICRGGATLIPEDNFWHSSPFSRQFHRCIHPDACVYPNRTEVLAEFYEDPIRLEKDLMTMVDYIKSGDGMRPEFVEYEQCAPGYEGILCGSCIGGYGRSFRGSCEECPGKRMKNIMLFLMCLVTFFMIGFNCWITLMSTRDRIQLVQREIRDRVVRPQLRRANNHIVRHHTVQAQMSRLMAGLAGDASFNSDFQCKLILTQQLVAAVQFTETVKILINYLQVTSAALRLPVEWRSILSGVLSFEAGLVGVMTEALSVPFECVFSSGYDLPKSILAIWLRLSTPIFILALLIMIYLVHRFIHRPKHMNPKNSRTGLLTGVIVITIVGIYFSYIDFVRELLRIINCVPVDSEVLANDHPYHDYSIFTGEKVWAEDTDLICFQGDHRVTGILGLIGLLLALLVIVFILVWLPLNRENETKTAFVARYWFIYQAYRKEWYTMPWETVILCRKILIAAVVVFSFQLGPSLQASLCVGTLIMAQMLQVTLRPFKVPDGHSYVPEYAGGFFTAIHAPKLTPEWIKLNNALSLNALESASLFSSILVFFSAIILTDHKSSLIGQNTMCLFAFCFNLAFLLYMNYRLYCGLHVLVDLKLEFSSPAFMATHENHMGPFYLLKKLRELYRLTRGQYLSEKEQQRSTELV